MAKKQSNNSQWDGEFQSKPKHNPKQGKQSSSGKPSGKPATQHPQNKPALPWGKTSSQPSAQPAPTPASPRGGKPNSRYKPQPRALPVEMYVAAAGNPLAQSLLMALQHEGKPEGMSNQRFLRRFAGYGWNQANTDQAHKLLHLYNTRGKVYPFKGKKHYLSPSQEQENPQPDLHIIYTYRPELKNPTTDMNYRNPAVLDLMLESINNVSSQEIFDQLPKDINGRPIIVTILGLTASPDDQRQAYENIYKQYESVYQNLPLDERPVIVAIAWNAEPGLYTDSPSFIDGANYLLDSEYRAMVDDTGIRLGDALEEFQRNNPFSEISIVGHSVGVEIILNAIQSSDAIFKDVALIQGASVSPDWLDSRFDELLDDERITGSLVITYNQEDDHESGYRMGLSGPGNSLAAKGYGSASNYAHIHNILNTLIASAEWADPHGRLEWVDFAKLQAILDCLDSAETSDEIDCMSE
ncbi:MAG: hypothetical protein JNJ61_11625 [Anaerolineae bacterium]|nr:hypothetical protein [Anaerolineae bacterium]